MAFSFLCRLFRHIVQFVRVHQMGDATKDAEIILLRHQLAVVRCQGTCLRFSWSDRAVIAAFRQTHSAGSVGGVPWHPRDDRPLA